MQGFFLWLKHLFRFATRSHIEFAEWITPFQNDDIQILEVQFLNGGFEYLDHKRNIGFKSEPTREIDGTDLLVRIRALPRGEDLSVSSVASIYSLKFESIGGFRVMDEGGFPDFWNATVRQGGRPALSTFKVRNHLWSWESAVPFAMQTSDGWSYVIATNDDCVEVLCKDKPAIRFEKTVAAHPLSDE